MNPRPPEPETVFDKDLKTFDRLPAKTKEAVILKDQAEKAIGPQSAALNKSIRDQAK